MKVVYTSTPEAFLKDLLLFPFASSPPAASVATLSAGVVGGRCALLKAPLAICH